jgi:hypothetical protein
MSLMGEKRFRQNHRVISTRLLVSNESDTRQKTHN